MRSSATEQEMRETERQRDRGTERQRGSQRDISTKHRGRETSSSTKRDRDRESRIDRKSGERGTSTRELTFLSDLLPTHLPRASIASPTIIPILIQDLCTLLFFLLLICLLLFLWGIRGWCCLCGFCDEREFCVSEKNEREWRLLESDSSLRRR